MMITTIITSVITAAITGIATFLIQERKIKQELRTEFMAEQAVRTLLENEKWKKRSYKEIRKRIGGFSDDDLKKILVRSGAVRFMSKNKETKEETELWGLMSRNEKDI